MKRSQPKQKPKSMIKRLLNHPVLEHSRFSKANLAIFTLIFAAIGGYILLQSHAAGTTANLWVDTTGGSCTRSATQAAYNASTSCGSLNAALAASQSGDLVLIKCGTYGLQTLTAVKSSGNVTFQSESGKCAVFDANGGLAINFSTNVGYLTIDSVTVHGQIIGTSSSTSQNNNITITNNDIDVGQKVNGPPIVYSIGSNLTISHNTIGPSCCGYNGGNGASPEGIRIGKPSTAAASCATQACNVTISDNLIQNTTRDCQYWPSSGFGSCPDTTCTNAVGCHMDGIHIWGMDGGNITGNRLYGVECQGIFLENTNNSLQRNINIVNNAISTVVGGCSNKGIYLSAGGSTNGANGFAGTWNIAFNSGDSSIIGPNDCGSCQTGTVFNFVGNNIVNFITNISGNNAGCSASAWGAATANFKYNIWRTGGSAVACGANDVYTTSPPAFVNEVMPPAVGNDLHLASASSQAIDFVPSSVCTPITTSDMDGDTRPQGAACDAGADEYTVGGGGTTPAPTVSISATPASITSGSSATLNWTTTNATSCTASNGWSGSKATSGSQSVSPTSTTTYALSCTGTGGTTPSSTTVTVTAPTPTVTISANPTTITSGSSSTLSWSSTNATSCTASGSWSGSVATSGSQSTGPLTTGSTFTLICIGAGGTSAPSSAQVTVNNAPPPPTPPSNPPTVTKKGDCNGDNTVNLTDLSILLSHYNQNYSPADFDGNSAVDLGDLSILLSNYQG